MNSEKIRTDLQDIQMLFSEPLANYTFTKTGGVADVLLFPKTADEVKKVVDYANIQEISWIVLGNASNLIVRDGGIRGFVLMLSEMNSINVYGNQLIAEAGAKLIDASYLALEASLSGLEFACGIPGSIGGAIYMNAGAYEGEISQVFESAELLFPDGNIRKLTLEEMDFSYRHSCLQENQGIVLSVTFTCEEGKADLIRERMRELTELRSAKQPLEYPSCGSVFKRPHGHFTGQLIQEAGLQGFQLGGAQISEKHAGFIVNRGSATATDYIQLIHYIQETIQEKFQVQLETEVRIIGEEKNPEAN